MSNPDTIILDNANFIHEVFESKLPILVDFWAPWCGPCRALAPAIHSLATDLSGQAKIGRVDVDENADLAAEYGVQSIPTLVFFKDGKQVDRIVGQPRERHSSPSSGLWPEWPEGAGEGPVLVEGLSTGSRLKSWPWPCEGSRRPLAL